MKKNCLAIVFLSVFVQLFTSTFSPALAAPDTPVTFTDPNLKSTVEIQLGITDPTESDMLLLTDLYRIASVEITDLTGLEYALNLESLHLDNYNITDISPITSLTNLKYLYLSGNNITNPENLGNITSLSLLNIGDCNISDISFLSNLPNLSKLFLGSNPITDFSILPTLPLLENIGIAYCNISDISFLSSMELSSVGLSGNPITDFTPICHMENLFTLYIADCNLTDISFLLNFDRISSLNISENPNITNYNILQSLSELQFLDMDNCNISDLSFLSSITSLRSIYAYDNQISDIAPLAGLPNLEVLGFRNNNIHDLAPLSAMTNLIFVNLNNNQLYCSSINEIIPILTANNPDYFKILYEDYSCLPDGQEAEPVLFNDPVLKAAVENEIGITNPTAWDMRNLYYLTVSSAGITDLTGLEHAHRLYELHLSHNMVTDLTPLSELDSLEYLYLYDNQITDLEPLTSLSNLRYLMTKMNPISCDHYFQDVSTILSNNPYMYFERHYTCNCTDPVTDMFNDPFLKDIVSDTLGVTDLTSCDMLMAFYLRISGYDISDLTGLEYAIRLHSLYAKNCSISDLSILAEMPSLIELYLDNNNITDISALTKLTNLTRLSLTGNPITCESYNRDLPLIIANNPGIVIEVDEICPPATIADLANMAAFWLTDCESNPTCLDCDLAPDGTINIQDFATLAQNWLQ